MADHCLLTADDETSPIPAQLVTYADQLDTFPAEMLRVLTDPVPLTEPMIRRRPRCGRRRTAQVTTGAVLCHRLMCAVCGGRPPSSARQLVPLHPVHRLIGSPRRGTDLGDSALQNRGVPPLTPHISRQLVHQPSPGRHPGPVGGGGDAGLQPPPGPVAHHRGQRPVPRGHSPIVSGPGRLRIPLAVRAVRPGRVPSPRSNKRTKIITSVDGCAVAAQLRTTALRCRPRPV